jgi:diguanylate cyclase (GGDEF)-like protein
MKSDPSQIPPGADASAARDGRRHERQMCGGRDQGHDYSDPPVPAVNLLASEPEPEPERDSRVDDAETGQGSAREGERRRAGQVRDEKARRRDDAADLRDERAAVRDQTARLEDQAALRLDGVGGWADGSNLPVRELRFRGIDGRRRASLARERAKRDRGLARMDRELGEHDREESRRDRGHAGTDELTGARRRGVGLEDLQHEIDRARRTSQSLTTAYVDVDGLKAVNDQQGHGAGDILLQAVVTALRDHMRSYDLLVRLGGDEFLCVMPGATADQARQRFEHLRASLATGSRARSVSVGLSELRDGDELMSLIDRADQNLLAGRRRP